MDTVKCKGNCDLCGQPVEIKGFSLATAEKLLLFCCAGCQSIYQLIYMNLVAKDSNNQTRINNEDN